jgi:hypothetical protein
MDRSGRCSRGRRDISAVYFKSFPAEKARSPSPVNTATQASSSFAKSSNTSPISRLAWA